MFDLIGKTLGPYRIIEQIGVGGMATVYKAYQPSMDRYVAVKVLPHYLSKDPEFAKRFQREARAIAKLEHAHILPVHDYGEYEGIAYIVMRYVEAGTLKDRMAQGPLPLDEIDRLIGQIGGALDYAHRLGVIHRDIKPGNVLLDTQGDTYLSDFGLARMMEATQQLTASGVGVGTPAYMSPEQGQGVKVDHRSDIYSLGVILYEMATGRVPYEAETPMAVMIKHITDPLPLPRTVKPDVPEPIERVILKALAKNPADRFQTAGELVQALAVAVRKASAAEAQRAPEPETVAEAERPNAAPAREDVSLVTRVQQVWEKPRGKVALAGGGVIALILLGALLSRIPGNIAITGPRVTGTAAAIAQATTTTAPTQATTATSASPTVTTISPTSSAVITPAAVAALNWEQVHNGAAFLRADVSALAVDPQHPEVIYAATTVGVGFGAGAGVYKSIDGGETWTPANTGLDPVATGIFIDPQDSQIIYATTFGAGPYKSTDGGANWKPINAGLTQLTGAWNGVSSLAFDPKDHLRLYHADPSAGIFYSTDGGETWQSISQPCQQFISLAIDPRDGGHLFAGAFYNPTCPGGLYESTDGGRSWTPIAQSIPDFDKAGVWRVVIDPSAPDSIYAHVEYPGLNRPSALITRTNDGKDWTVARTTGGRLAIAVNPNTSGNVYIGDGVELHRSDDGGRTWVSLRGGFEGNIATLTFGGDTLYVGAAGVSRTSNGGQSWKAGASGFGNTWLELAFDPSGKTLYAEDNHCALYDSPDGGLTWEKLRSSGCGLAFNRKNGVLYRAGQNVLYSTDGGRTWSNTGKSPSGKDNYRIYVNPQDANILYWLQGCCSTTLYRSTDGGQTWEALPTANDLYHGRMVIASDGARMYAADYGNVEASDDGGQAWRACQTTTNNNGNPPALALHPQDRDTLLLGTWGTGVLKTTNACESWSTANAGLDNLFVNSLAFDPLNPETVYAGTDSGVFLSQDGGDSWSALNDGLAPNPIVYSIAVDPNDSSKVYAVTPDGIFRLVGVPSVAVEPTPAPGTLAEQARAFAEPILQAIADRPLDFEDDFSTGGRGWRSSESYRIENGSLEISVPEGETYGGTQHSQMWASDFVFQVDARADVLERDSYVGIQLRENIPGSYSVSLYPQQRGRWMIIDHVDGTALAQGSAPGVVAMGQWMKVVIIARGSQFAVFVNDQPIAYFVDDTLPDGQNMLSAGGPGGGRADVKFDNVKFWNLENVPGLP